MAGKLPYLAFFPDDWLSDERLRLCSLAARGLWIDLLCLMHKCVRRGFLIQANGQPYSNEQIARISGCSTEEAAHLLQELATAGVTSVCESGAIFNRRMVRDEQKRAKCSDAGKKGGGNPEFKNRQRGGLTFKGQPKGASKGGAKGQHKGPLGLDCTEEDRDSEVLNLGILSWEESGARIATPGTGPPELTPEWLANEWVFHCTRRRNRGPADDPVDIASSFGEMIRQCELHGKTTEQILAEIRSKARNHDEYFWEFRKRLFGEKVNGNRSAPAEGSRHRYDPQRDAGKSQAT